MPKIIHYRKKCIGCGVCYEQQPEQWRMSKKDGKATLLKAAKNKEIHIVNIPESAMSKSEQVAIACPVRIIKVS